jgi:hypothetical protein
LIQTPITSVRGLYFGLDESPVSLLECEYKGDATLQESVILKSALESGYEDIGLDLDSTLRIEPDHIAAECLYLGLLAKLEADAWESEDFSSLDRILQVEITFMRDHPCKWFSVLATVSSPSRIQLTIELRVQHAHL